jgi:FkbM family methyltransferase
VECFTPGTYTGEDRRGNTDENGDWLRNRLYPRLAKDTITCGACPRFYPNGVSLSRKWPTHSEGLVRKAGTTLERLHSAWRPLAYLVERFLLGRRVLTARLPEFGLTMRVSARDVVGRHLYKYRIHEPLLSRFVVGQLELRPGDVVFDVGANIGWYSLLIGRFAPAGVEVFAFEPAPANYDLLVENLRRNGISAVAAVQAAVGEGPGRATLHLYGESNRGRNSLLPVHEGRTVEVDIVSLDDFCRQRALTQRPIGFLKLDVEGYEYFALKGAAETLRRCRVVLTEFSPTYLTAAGIEPSALLDLFAAAGFRPYSISESGLDPADLGALRTSNEQVDLLWLPNDGAKATSTCQTPNDEP